MQNLKYVNCASQTGIVNSHLFSQKPLNGRKSKELEEEEEKCQLQQETKDIEAHLSIKLENSSGQQRRKVLDSRLVIGKA